MQTENGMREALRQIGQQALGIFLSSMQATPESEIDCPCGGKLQYQRMQALFGYCQHPARAAGCIVNQVSTRLDLISNRG